jgi:hypothetical protein
MENIVGIEITEDVERAVEDRTLGPKTLALDVIGTAPAL